METTLRRVRVVVPWDKGQMDEPKAGQDSRRRSRLLAWCSGALNASDICPWLVLPHVSCLLDLSSFTCELIALGPVNLYLSSPSKGMWLHQRQKQLAGVLE